MKVWLYYRLSRDEDDELNSLTNQRKIIYEYAVTNGHEVVGESFDDNVSGMHFNREGIDKIYEVVEAGKIEAIIVKDLSRLGRHRTQTALFIDYLREHDVRVLSATENIDTFNENDELIAAYFSSGEDEIIVGATNGNCIRFSEKDVRPTSRTAMGVKSIELPEGAEVVDMAVLKEGSEILTITEKGFGKRSEYPDYPKQGRAGKGVKAGVFNSKTGRLVALKVLPPEMDVMIITNGGIIIRMVADEISKFGRDTQGVKVMRLKADELISSVTLTPHEDEEEEQTDGEDFISKPEEVDISQDSIPTETPSTPQTDKPQDDEE